MIVDSRYKNFLFIPVLFIVIEVSTYAGITLIPYLLLGIFFVVYFYSKEWGLNYLICLLFLSEDNSRYLDEGHQVVTLYTISNFNIVITIMLFGLLVNKLIAHKLTINRQVYFKFLSFFLLILLFGTIGGIGNLSHGSRSFIHDISYVVNTLVLAGIVLYSYKSEGSITTLIITITLAVSISYLYQTGLFILGEGSMAGSNIRVSYDSARSLIPFFSVLFFTLFLNASSFSHQKRQVLLLKIFAFGFFLISLLLNFSNASRSSMLFILLGLLISIFLGTNGFVKKTKRLFSVAIFIVAAFFLMDVIQPNSTKFVLWKLRSTLEVDVTAEKFSSTSTIVRFIELSNIYEQHKEEGTMLIGSGFGSYFTDLYVPYPFSLFGKSAYPDDQIVNHKFYKPHTTPIFLFLKIGVLGVALYYLPFLLLLGLSIRKIPIIRNNIMRVYVIACSASLFLFATKNFSSKMQIVTGILYGILLVILTNSDVKKINGEQRKIANESPEGVESI